MKSISTQNKLRYIELKTGYEDNGPAWIGKARYSKSGSTLYFNGKAFKKYNGISGNYFETESGDEYWISGVKKNGQDRHSGRKGIIQIDATIVTEYLQLRGLTNLPTSQYKEVELDQQTPKASLYEKENA